MSCTPPTVPCGSASGCWEPPLRRPRPFRVPASFPSGKYDSTAGRTPRRGTETPPGAGRGENESSCRVSTTYEGNRTRSNGHRRSGNMATKGYAAARALIAVVVPGLGCATAASLHAPAVQSGYAPVNGLQMYYEVYGSANGGIPPLVLLHGGGSTIETSFRKVLPSLAKTRRVIAFEQQGHGRTADIADRPFTFEQSADDAAGLLRH